MALVFPGKTLCRGCGKLIQTGDGLVLFPAFLRPGHRLGRFSDSAFHAHCFAQEPDAKDVGELFERFQAIWARRPEVETLEEIEEWGRTAFRELDDE